MITAKIVCFVFLGTTVLFSWSFSQSSVANTLQQHTIDGGGISSGKQYTLIGMIGQQNAPYSEGGQYELLGGFVPSAHLGIVEFKDFARFATFWMQTGSGLPADLYEDGKINYEDLLEFTNVWLSYVHTTGR